MKPESDTIFGADKLVRRGEFALYASRTMGYTTVTTASGYFSDVDTNTEEGAAIEMLVNLGAISKSGTEYNPNEEVTVAEASRIMMSLLGYSKIAEARGGYPSGYISVADENELFKNVSKSADSVITKPEAATILYNALFIYLK